MRQFKLIARSPQCINVAPESNAQETEPYNCFRALLTWHSHYKRGNINFSALLPQLLNDLESQSFHAPLNCLNAGFQVAVCF